MRCRASAVRLGGRPAGQFGVAGVGVDQELGAVVARHHFGFQVKDGPRGPLRFFF